MKEKGLKIRRGKRLDFAAVRALVASQSRWEGLAEKKLARLFRRLVKNLGYDLYVAEHQGHICGVVVVSYHHLLVQGGLCALVNTLIAPEGEIRRGLFAFALERAQKRGCRRVEVQIQEDQREEWDGLLAAYGFREAGRWFSRTLP